MAAQKLSDLLPVDDANPSPHAYQIFGLEVGEEDLSEIVAAVQVTVNHLRSIKSETEPALWQKAAQLVQAGRVTLADPEKKAALDARFGIVSFDKTAATPKAASVDPLAGMLPPVNPLAPVKPVAHPSPQSTPASAIPPGIFGTASEPTPAPQSPSTVAPPAPLIRKVRPVTTRRRRGLMGSLVMATFMLGMAAVIASLVYFLLFGPGAIAISSKDGELTISTGPASTSNGPAIATPREIDETAGAPRKPPRPRDPVMGTMGGNVPPPPPVTVTDPVIPVVAPEMTPSIPTVPPPAPEPEMPAPPPEITDAMAAEADAGIERVSQTIREAKWTEMKTVAETVAEMPMKPEQQIIADGLLHLADLATFYRGGIETGIRQSSTGDEIEVKEGIRISLVERGADFLVIRLNGKNRSYQFDELPSSLVDKLAAFAIQEGPTRRAANAVYLSVVPNSNQGFRDDAVRTLSELSGQVEGADSERMIAAIKHLYSSGE